MIGGLLYGVLFGRTIVCNKSFSVFDGTSQHCEKRYKVITARIRRMTGGYIFTLCVSPQGGGRGTYLPGGGGVPTQVWVGGGVTYLLRSGLGGTYHLGCGGGGYLLSGLDGGGGYLLRSGWGGVPTLAGGGGT